MQGLRANQVDSAKKEGKNAELNKHICAVDTRK